MDGLLLLEIDKMMGNVLDTGEAMGYGGSPCTERPSSMKRKVCIGCYFAQVRPNHMCSAPIPGRFCNIVMAE